MFLEIILGANLFIIKLLLTPLLLVMKVGSIIPNWLSDFTHYLEIGLFFIPLDVFGSAVILFTTWYLIQLIFGIINFIIKKIPGIN